MISEQDNEWLRRGEAFTDAEKQLYLRIFCSVQKSITRNAGQIPFYGDFIDKLKVAIIRFVVKGTMSLQLENELGLLERPRGFFTWIEGLAFDDKEDEEAWLLRKGIKAYLQEAIKETDQW